MFIDWEWACWYFANGLSVVWFAPVLFSSWDISVTVFYLLFDTCLISPTLTSSLIDYMKWGLSEFILFLLLALCFCCLPRFWYPYLECVIFLISTFGSMELQRIILSRRVFSFWEFSWRGRRYPEKRRLRRAEEILFGWRFIFLRSSLSSGELVGEGKVSKRFFWGCDALGGFGSLEEERFFRDESFWLAGRVSQSEEEKGKESAWF